MWKCVKLYKKRKGIAVNVNLNDIVIKLSKK